MSNFITALSGHIRATIMQFMSLITPLMSYSFAVYTLSLEDAIKKEKFIGPFTKRRKIATVFGRH